MCYTAMFVRTTAVCLGFVRKYFNTKNVEQITEVSITIKLYTVPYSIPGIATGAATSET